MNRPDSFSKLLDVVTSTDFPELGFTDSEILLYRNFSSDLVEACPSIEQGSTYNHDDAEIIAKLTDLYRETMLEPTIPKPNNLLRIFINGSFRFWPNCEISTNIVRDFLNMLQAMPGQKRAIVISNICSKLDAIKRTEVPKNTWYGNIDDEIPF